MCELLDIIAAEEIPRRHMKQGGACCHHEQSDCNLYRYIPKNQVRRHSKNAIPFGPVHVVK